MGALQYSERGIGAGRVKSARTDLNGLSFDFDAESETIRVRSKLLGIHNIGPLCAAAHIGKRLGLTSREIESGLSKTSAFEHRLQPRREGGITIIDDSYNGNPDGARAAIRFLSAVSAKRRFYVTPGFVEMGPRTESVHEELGRELGVSGIEKIVLIRNSVAAFIEGGLRKAKYRGDVMDFPSMPEALSAMKNMTVDGDVVLIQNDWPDQYV